MAEGLVTWTEVTTAISIDDVDRLLMTHRLLNPPPEDPKRKDERVGSRGGAR